MTIQEYDQFRSDFKSIVCKRGLLKSKVTHMSRMEAFNKNDSHKAAIDRSIENIKKTKIELENMLCKYSLSYSKILEFSKKLSKIKTNKKTFLQNLEKINLSDI